MNPGFKEYLLQITKSSDCKELEVIQSLWSGYGRISRYELFGATVKTVVVKYIALNQSTEHLRGWKTHFGHLRKVKSYQVETAWYKDWSQHCTEECRIPAFIGSYAEDQDQWIVMEDLNSDFPRRKSELEMKEVRACLNWLANFHATFMGKEPVGLWEIGTYWHLRTRPDEWDRLEHAELKAKAEAIDQALNDCRYKTIVHGDAKLANFCFSECGDRVAAVDFQYVGGGCGMKDVAYFLGSCLSSQDYEKHQEALLAFYFSALKSALTSSNIKFEELELEWRRMYPFAHTDFTRFLLGWMPSHRKINGYGLRMMNSVLAVLE